MIQQMENSLKLGRKLIDTELDTGILNFFIKPVIKTFYDYWAKHEAKSGTLNQIDITLDSGRELLLNGNTDESFDKSIEENFPKYFKNDQTYRVAHREHKNYGKLKNIAKKTFINYMKEVIKFLNVKEDVQDYGDLCRIAFNSKELAKENLMKQLSFTEEAINLIEEDLSILKLPVGKKILVKALRKGFEVTKEEFFVALHETYLP
jgi:hypothetical protein